MESVRKDIAGCGTTDLVDRYYIDTELITTDSKFEDAVRCVKIRDANALR
jgi:hypothetical protein